ncbi:MAG: GNAT family N-acetyltransferase [Nonomuraea sp.]|nr:GNAT family N-acetyltransferase [Nonomuraea sp.]NUP61460.1 GNAT family N-acetyltransferase [Nonomuraea sp.]NUS07947.1 GNAT family N-acetyltransferase [Nonomuraea sp.]NUT09033.1 GNAT family N-acetyltransferase [Nonomuraea sp.]
MRIQPIDLDRPGELLTGLHDTYLAGYTHEPGPTFSLARFGVILGTRGGDDRVETWVMTDGGKVIGGYGLALPQHDNPRMGWLFPLVVRPELRGRGLGGELFEHALGRLRANGRSLLLSETPETGIGARFARSHGMQVALREARRTLDLRTADWSALRAMRPEVEGYHLERFQGPAAPELLGDLATLMGGMNDAPRDASVEDAVYDADRLRAGEESISLGGQTSYTMIARRDSDGAPAGFTRICLAADRSNGWGHQTDTTVLREHRGHRLGLLLKIDNLLWLRESEPHLERIITWNATSNAHMLAINEAMGFELLDEWIEWRLTV